MRYADVCCKYVENEDFYFYSGTCILCRRIVYVSIPCSELFAYRQGKLIQDAMPSVSADNREFLISGTCSVCFNSMFKEKVVKKDNLKVSIVEEGKKGTKLHLKAGDKEFLRFSATLDWDTDIPEFHDEIQAAVEKAVADSGLDGLEVDLADPESVKIYLVKTQLAIASFMEVITRNAQK